MEQIITVFGVNWKLLVIQIVNFGVLLLVLYRFLYGPLLRLIEERREKVAQGLQDAANAEAKLKEIEGERSAIIKKSLTEAEAAVITARKRGEAQEKSIIQNANERGAKVITEARAAAEGEKEKTLRAAEAEIARMAVLGAEKILRENA